MILHLSLMTCGVQSVVLWWMRISILDATPLEREYAHYFGGRVDMEKKAN